MHKTGQHFTEGTQYETALLHQRMRNRQPGRIDHPVVIKKNIDIEGTRTVLPAHRFMIRPCGLITTGSGLASGSGCDTVCRSRTDPPRLPLDLLANIEHMFRLQSRLEDQNLIEKLFRRLESPRRGLPKRRGSRFGSHALRKFEPGTGQRRPRQLFLPLSADAGLQKFRGYPPLTLLCPCRVLQGPQEQGHYGPNRRKFLPIKYAAVWLFRPNSCNL